MKIVEQKLAKCVLDRLQQFSEGASISSHQAQAKEMKKTDYIKAALAYAKHYRIRERRVSNQGKEVKT